MTSLRSIALGLLLAFFTILPTAAPASRTFNGTSSYIEGSTAAVTAEPLTMACWFKSASVAAPKTLLSIGTSGGTARHQLIEAQNLAVPVRADSIDSGGSLASASATGSISTGQWYHAAGVWTASNSRAAYLNGANSGTNTTSITVSGTNRTMVGARISAGTVGSFYAGEIAEAAIWNVALTADELKSLAAGFSPRLIRPQSLVFYAPLIATVQDIRAGIALTDTSTTSATHPPVRQ